MKKAHFLTIFAAVLLLAGCSANESSTGEQKIVNVTEVRQMEYETGFNYLGIVRAKDTKNYSFLSGGRLEEVYVKVGDQVMVGTPLAKLDTSSLEISINTARTNVNSLKSSVDTAKSALDATASLHAHGYISDKEWEAQNNQFVTLSGNYDMAVDSLKQAEKSLKESTLYADEDGVVMEVPYKAGEVIGSGYPAVILKSNQKVVTIGVSAEDIGEVDINSTVLIDTSIKGTVDSIDQYPDENTRTYPVDVIFESDQYMIGDMVDVQITTGKALGCFVPIQSLFNIDGLDFVYMVNGDGVVSRRQITREELREDMVRVEGVEPGMSIINDGLKNIKENDQVMISPSETTYENTESQNKDGES